MQRYPASNPSTLLNMLPPLAFGLLHETNRHRIEKAFNFAYNHILTERSNHSKNNLWTTSEFQVVQRNGVATNSATTDEAQSTNDDVFDFDELSANEDKEDKSGTYRGSRLTYSLPVVPLSSLHRRSQTSTQRDTSPSPRSENPPDLPTATPSTPPNARTQPDMPSTDRTIPIRQGIDRSRIADFAVAYLETKPGSRSIFGMSVPLFQLVRIPIIVEGKRPPPRTDMSSGVEPELLRDQIFGYMDLGKRDIIEKMPAFFSAYPSTSYVGIVFAGPWWTFTICTPGATETTLRWSKVFAYDSPKHEDALNIIFHAAQNHPDNPQADGSLVGLLEQYADPDVAALTLVT
ncbi:hypothetical protein FRC10_007241 [Ceratobasidium sp. 414]|nr:hypothetical protein FRC10_007241 [Ceratobasidium sp. 414]